MKAQNGDNSDDQLSRLLGEWKIEDRLAPAFEGRVWQRIKREARRAQENSWSGKLERLLEELRRPALATSFVTVLLLGGMGIGYWHSRIDNEHMLRELGTRYVQLMEPYQSSAH